MLTLEWKLNNTQENTWEVKKLIFPLLSGIIRNPFHVKVEDVSEDLQETVNKFQNYGDCKEMFESNVNPEEF